MSKISSLSICKVFRAGLICEGWSCRCSSWWWDAKGVYIRAWSPGTKCQLLIAAQCATFKRISPAFALSSSKIAPSTRIEFGTWEDAEVYEVRFLMDGVARHLLGFWWIPSLHIRSNVILIKGHYKRDAKDEPPEYKKGCKTYMYYVHQIHHLLIYQNDKMNRQCEVLDSTSNAGTLEDVFGAALV